MAFDKNYLLLKCQSTANGPSTWTYRDTAAASAVRAAGYLAINSHMRLGDIVEFQQVDALPNMTSITATTVMVVVGINATTGYPDLSDGTAIAVTNT